MKNHQELNVREIEEHDVPLLCAYWMDATPEYLLDLGVDLSKMPNEDFFRNMLMKQIETPITKKQSYAVIWEIDGEQVGHSNVNGIEFGKHATMHLHLWNSKNRKKGMGSQLLKLSLPFYFENLQIETLYCEPYALNPAPNHTLKRIGFTFIKNYETIPGSLNRLQYVNRYELTRQNYLKLIDQD